MPESKGFVWQRARSEGGMISPSFPSTWLCMRHADGCITYVIDNAWEQARNVTKGSLQERDDMSFLPFHRIVHHEVCIDKCITYVRDYAWE
jgi:hypothetical protein